MTKRIAVFGGRDWTDARAVHAALDRLLARHGALVVVCGMCPSGADLHACEWARERSITVDPFPADWTAHGRAAWPRRNRAMARSGLAGAVGFPGGNGTANMATECADAGVAVWWPCGKG